MLNSDIAYKTLRIEDVQENTWNPNVMPKADYEGLKKSLDVADGNSKQPILVRSIPGGKYEIIDGAHRYKAMKELGFDDVLAIILEVDDAHARMKTIAMNKLRGTTDPVKLSELVAELKKTYGMTEEEIQGELAVEQQELAELSKLTDFDMSFMYAPVEDIQLAPEGVVMRLDFSKEEAEEFYRLAALLQLSPKELVLKAVRNASTYVGEVVSETEPEPFDISDITL